MGYNDPCPKPALFPWVDLTPLRGSTVFGVTVSNSAGRYRSIWHCGPMRIATALTNFSNGVWGCDINGLFFTYSQGTSQYPRITSHNAPGTAMNAGLTLPIYPSSRGGTRTVRFPNVNGHVNIFFNDDTFTYATSSSATGTGTGYFNTYFSNYFLKTGELAPNNLFNEFSSIQAAPNSALEASNNNNTSDSTWQKLPIMRPFAVENLASQDSVKYFRPIAFFPSRPLPTAPLLIESCTSVDHVTIGGRTYHSQHSKRKLWQCEMLLDGALDVNTNTYPQFFYTAGNLYGSWNLDCETGWDTFLGYAESGVTLLVDSTIGVGIHTRPAFAAAFPGSPNVISGQLIDCSKLTLTHQNNLNRRFKVTLTIAEETPY